MERQVTAQNYRQVLCWLRGGDHTSNPEMEDMFLDVITSMVQERLKSEERTDNEESARRRADTRKSYKSPISLRSLVDSMYERGETDITYDEMMEKKASGNHVQTPEPKAEYATSKAVSSELDSVMVGNVFRYMGALEKVSLNMSQIQMMMYISYGVWLASTGNRLTSEHPQMWQFGPVFPRAYNKMRKDTTGGKSDYESLRSSRPEIMEFLGIQFRRFAWTKASVLSIPHTAQGTPWAKTRKKNPEKWGVPMDDADISAWFASRMNR